MLQRRCNCCLCPICRVGDAPSATVKQVNIPRARAGDEATCEAVCHFNPSIEHKIIVAEIQCGCLSVGLTHLGVQRRTSWPAATTPRSRSEDGTSRKSSHYHRTHPCVVSHCNDISMIHGHHVRLLHCCLQLEMKRNTANIERRLGLVSPSPHHISKLTGLERDYLKIKFECNT